MYKLREYQKYTMAQNIKIILKILSGIADLSHGAVGALNDGGK